MYYYSKTTGGFYDTDIHGHIIPQDAVLITLGQYAELISGQSRGKIISHDDNGYPTLINESEKVLTFADKTKIFVSAVQAHLDATARGLGYDDIEAAVSYADEPAVPRFQAEGQALRKWRSLYYEAFYAILADTEKRNRPEPESIEALIAELPSFVFSTEEEASSLIGGKQLID